MRGLEIALPVPGSHLDQDEEWVVVRQGRGWRKIRLHDYNEVYSVPGLYEKWIYELFQCRSPQKIRELLGHALEEAGVGPGSLRVLDLGAGNGCVAEELQGLGVEHFVGVDIHDEAAEAAERDRPGLYEDYVVGDLTALAPAGEAKLASDAFDCMTCVAALGFGDIPTEVFAAAFNRVEDGGWIAFTIKSDFLKPSDQSGFSSLIRRMVTGGVLELRAKETYQHRISTDGEPLLYDALVGRKRSDIPPSLLGS
ncbi:MAG: class I SAM-dependent methyltransferase [Phycisphaerales bacterium]|nr:class I SAM-dependent methyltransferase [Phycisphaerales bacterium]